MTAFATSYVQMSERNLLVAVGAPMLLGTVSTVLAFATLTAVLLTDRRGGEATLNEAFEVSLVNVGMVAITGSIVHSLVWIGSLCLVVPGLVIGLVLFPAPFLSGTLGLGPVAAIERSVALAKRFYAVFLVTMALAFAAAMGIGGAGLLVYMIADVSLAGQLTAEFQSGTTFSTVLVWGVTSTLGYFGWLWGGAVLCCIADREGIDPPVG